MQVELVKTSRRPSWPVWAVALVLVWLTVGGLTVWLGKSLGRGSYLCVFKELTGIPCPTCGLTRGTLCLLHAQPISAWLRNPFIFSLLALFFLATMMRLVFGRSLRIELTDGQRKTAWLLGTAAFLVNWAYVVLYVG